MSPQHYTGPERRKSATPDPANGPWHLDKRVPIALIFTMLVQTAGMVWWAGTLNNQVQNHERRIERIETTDRETATFLAQVGEKLARLEERSASTNDLLRRIVDKLDRFAPANTPAR